MIVFKNSKDDSLSTGDFFFFLENHKPHDVTVHDIQTDQQSGLVQQKKTLHSHHHTRFLL